MIKEIVNELFVINKIIDDFTLNGHMSFKQAWTLFSFYDKYKNTGEIIDCVEKEITNNPICLAENAHSLKIEASHLLFSYHDNKKKIDLLDFSKICSEHLLNYQKAFEEAQVISQRAYQEFLEIDHRLNNPENFGDKQLEEECEILKNKSDKLGEITKSLRVAHFDEIRKTSHFAFFKIGSIIILVSVFKEIADIILKNCNV